METMNNEALKYVGQAKKILLGKTEMGSGQIDEMIDEIIELLDKAEESLVKDK